MTTQEDIEFARGSQEAQTISQSAIGGVGVDTNDNVQRPN